MNSTYMYTTDWWWKFYSIWSNIEKELLLKTLCILQEAQALDEQETKQSHEMRTKRESVTKDSTGSKTERNYSSYDKSRKAKENEIESEKKKKKKQQK